MNLTNRKIGSDQIEMNIKSQIKIAFNANRKYLVLKVNLCSQTNQCDLQRSNHEKMTFIARTGYVLSIAFIVVKIDIAWNWCYAEILDLSSLNNLLWISFVSTILDVGTGVCVQNFAVGLLLTRVSIPHFFQKVWPHLIRGHYICCWYLNRFRSIWFPAQLQSGMRCTLRNKNSNVSNSNNQASE